MNLLYDGMGERVFSLRYTQINQVDTVTTRTPGHWTSVTVPVTEETTTKDSKPQTSTSTEQPKKEKPVQDSAQAGEAADENSSRNIFWYGFGQSALRFLAFFNQSQTAQWSAAFRAWWFAQEVEITAEPQQYSEETKEALTQQGYTEKDVQMLQSAGVSEAEIRRIFVKGKEQASTKTYLADVYDATYYVNDILAENTEVLTVSSQYYGDTSYTYGNERLYADSTASAQQAYTYDGRGSVVQVLEKLAVVNTYRYTDYGTPTVATPSPYATYYGYNGEEHDALTGLQYLRARYYSSNAANFISQDTYTGTLDNPLSQNRYTYTENNPVNFADPSGHSIWGNIKNTVSKAVTTVKNTVTNAVNTVKNFANKVTNTVKAATHAVVNTVKNIFTPNTGNKNSYPLTAKSNFSSPGSYPAAEYASVFTNVGYTPAQNPTYTVKTIGGKPTLVPAHFDNPTAAATSFVKERGCDPSKAKAKKQEASGWLEDVKNVGKSVYNYLSESASHWGSKALHPTGVGDFLYSGANWLTYGLVNGVVQGYKDRNDTMWQNPSTYNIINWASSGLLDTAKGTFAPEKPLSVEHWLNSASFALVLYGGYTAAKNISSTAPANTISTPHPSTGTGMLDDFADEGAGGANSIFSKGKDVLKRFNLEDAYVKPKHLSTSGGNGAKFLGGSKAEAEVILKDAMSSGKIASIVDDGVSALGNTKFEITIDAGKAVGTKGETFIKVILSEDGGMLSAYPVK